MKTSRRGFLKSLLGVAVAPIAAVAGFSGVSSWRGRRSMDAGFIYCPYIPLITQTNVDDFLVNEMSMEIQKEIDNEIINSMRKYTVKHNIKL